MEQQHPIPQEISSYQFRLVGDMTLKQFFQLAGGLLVSLLFYASNLPAIIKWPFILLFASIGASLAFLPFEDRPLDKWILAFFKSVYTPTIFKWKKTAQAEQYFQAEAEAATAVSGEVQIAPSPTPQPKFMSKLEEAEKAFLHQVGGLFNAKGAQAPTPQQVQPQAPMPQPAQPTPPVQKSAPKPEKPKEPKKDEGGIQIPKTDYVRVKAQNGKRPRLVVEEKGVPKKVETEIVAPIYQARKPSSTAKKAVFSEEASPPSPPTNPNTVAGQVLDYSGKIVDAAILEIQDVGGRPVRAVKTNKLGHFYIVTPLQNGKYKMVTEKEGLKFNDASFEAKGEIIPPIVLRSRSSIKTEEV